MPSSQKGYTFPRLHPDFLTQVEAVLMVCAAIVILEVLGSIPGIVRIPNPAVLLLAAVSLAAFRGGVAAVCVSVMLVVAYEWFHFSAPGRPFTYSHENFIRAWLFTLGCPVVAAVVTKLKHDTVVAAHDLAVLQERERHARELLNQQARLESLVRQLPIGVVLVDDNNKVVVSNERAWEIVGHGPEDFDHPGHDRMMLSDGTPFTPSEMPVVRALRGEVVHDTEVIYVRGDGRVVILNISAAPVKDSSGNTTGAVLTLDDVTVRRHAERAYEELAAVVRASDDAILTVNAGGMILSWNQGAERLLGYPESEARTMTLESLVPSESRAEVDEVFNTLQSGTHPMPFRSVLRRRDGTTVATSLRFSPIYGKAGAVTAVSVIARQEP